MQTIDINANTTVELYTSIKEIPIHIRKKFDSYVLQDAGIGSNMADMDAHLEKLFAFAQASDKKEELLNEAKNLRYNFFLMLTGWNYNSISFACLIKKVNKVVVEDYSPDGLRDLLDELGRQGLTGEMVEDTLDDIKKNLMPNASYTFQSTSEPIPFI